MNFYEFGEGNVKRIVMIHGLSMTWDMMQSAIDILKGDYHIIAVAVPGHDIEEKDEFPSDRFSKELIEKEIKGLQSMTAKSVWRAYDAGDAAYASWRINMFSSRGILQKTMEGFKNR